MRLFKMLFKGLVIILLIVVGGGGRGYKLNQIPKIELRKKLHRLKF